MLSWLFFEGINDAAEDLGFATGSGPTLLNKVISNITINVPDITVFLTFDRQPELMCEFILIINGASS